MPKPGQFDWEEFFVLYGPLARRVAAGCVGPELAEEVVQDAARELLQTSASAPEAFRSRAHARNAWLRTIRNRCTDELRRGGRRPTHEDAVDVGDPRSSPLDELASEEARARLRARVRTALASLSPAEREVLELRFGEGLGFREIRGRTGTAISTLHARVGSGLAKIRDRLGNDEAEA